MTTALLTSLKNESVNLRSGPILAVLHTFSLTATAKIFVSPCPPECYLPSETKIEPDLRL